MSKKFLIAVHIDDDDDNDDDNDDEYNDDDDDNDDDNALRRLSHSMFYHKPSDLIKLQNSMTSHAKVQFHKIGCTPPTRILRFCKNSHPSHTKLRFAHRIL